MMLTQQKILQVKKQLRAGMPEGEIKIELLQEGYSKEEIEQLFQPSRPDMRSWYLISAVLFAVVGLYLYLKNESLFMLIPAAIMFAVYYRQQAAHANKK